MCVHMDMHAHIHICMHALNAHIQTSTDQCMYLCMYIYTVPTVLVSAPLHTRCTRILFTCFNNDSVITTCVLLCTIY